VPEGDTPTEPALEDTDANPDTQDPAPQDDESAPAGADDTLDASTEELVKQAYEAGFAAAQAEAATAQPSPEAEDAAYLRGLEEGQRQAKDELEAEVLLAADDLKALANQLAQAARDTETFYQPLLKLSMHLAEQLVRGELSLSGQAITRLVERCLSEFQQETSAPIVVRMNPADHERHLAYGAMAPKNMDLRPDPSLSSGSVKVSMNGAMIEDLIEHRRQALWDALMSAAAAPDDDLPDSFLRNVAIVKEAMASVDDEGAQPTAL
jgi:flagellar biosynthesis/type III secretory pathway protein FliH